MAETTPGIGDLLNLLGTANPLGALTKNLDTLKKGVEGFVTAVQTFTRTMETLEEATKRITALMDDIEAPVRSVITQLAGLPEHAIPTAIENLNKLSTGVSQLMGPLSGVAGLAGSLFGGLLPTPPVHESAAQAAPPATPSAKAAPRKRPASSTPASSTPASTPASGAARRRRPTNGD